MSTASADAPRPLPERPNLRHLKDQARDLLKAGNAESLADALYKIARHYGFATWPRLKAHVESIAVNAAPEEVAKLKEAIDTNDLDKVKTLMLRNPALHRAPLGYSKNGPLTWVAECRVPREPPSQQRLAIAKWMLENGSDVHQGGDGPLMRAALVGYRIPMMELLVSHGADVNAEWNGYFPIIFAPCETLEPAAIKWLLNQGARPNCARPDRKYPGTALDYVVRTYGRSHSLGACIDVLRSAGGTTEYNIPAVLDLLRGRVDLLARHLDSDPALLSRRFPELDFGVTGARRLTLKGATLLHMAAEYGNLEAATLLLERGAEVDAPAAVDEQGIGGQTPLFHAVTQYFNFGLPVGQLLIERGADLSVRAKVPGHYEKPDETVECTALGYARLFPGDENEAVALLREYQAPE